MTTEERWILLAIFVPLAGGIAVGAVFGIRELLRGRHSRKVHDRINSIGVKTERHVKHCPHCVSGLMLETQYMGDDDPVFLECQACGWKEDL